MLHMLLLPLYKYKTVYKYKYIHTYIREKNSHVRLLPSEVQVSRVR